MISQTRDKIFQRRRKSTTRMARRSNSTEKMRARIVENPCIECGTEMNIEPKGTFWQFSCTYCGRSETV